MKAFIVDNYGKDVPLRAGELPAPVPGEHDVLIAVHAAGVNPIDSKIKAGEFKLILPFKAPFVLGRDLAGVVTAVGSAVRRFAPGDEVYASLGKATTGAFAELVAVNEDEVARKPADVSMAEAAALPLVTLTAWQVLVEKADVRPGDRVLIHAGSGGVGSIAIQLAKHLGAHVATTTSTNNVDWVRELGADPVIDYRTQDFTTLVRDYDLVLDSLGGKTLEESLRVVRPGGLVIGPVDRPTRTSPASSASRCCDRCWRCSAARSGGWPAATRSPTPSCSCARTGRSCARSPLSSTRARSIPSSIGSSTSPTPSPPWITSTPAAPRARSSSR
jgi:NADPH:quinone reductase-like Zn-dependent oxidoreductase